MRGRRENAGKGSGLSHAPTREEVIVLATTMKALAWHKRLCKGKEFRWFTPQECDLCEPDAGPSVDAAYFWLRATKHVSPRRMSRTAHSWANDTADFRRESCRQGRH